MEPDSPFRLLFRTWSSSSAGTNSRRGFRSGDQNRREMGRLEKAKHFINHSDMNNRFPTCFISTTDDPVRALKYAIDLDAQGARGIQISIIRSNEYLDGEEAAAEVSSILGPINESLFKTEFLFRWEIASADILHVVPLKTLVGSGLLKKFKVLDPELWGGAKTKTKMRTKTKTTMIPCLDFQRYAGRSTRIIRRLGGKQIRPLGQGVRAVM